MQSVIRQTGYHVCRNGYIRELRYPGLPVLAIQRMLDRAPGRIPHKHRFGVPDSAYSMLHPWFGEDRGYASVPHHVAVHVRQALCGHDGFQVRRVERGDMPLAHDKVRNSAQADVAITPRLYARPLDHVVKRIRLNGSKNIEIATRSIRPGAIGGDDDIPVMNPILRVGRLEGRVLRNDDLSCAFQKRYMR